MQKAFLNDRDDRLDAIVVPEPTDEYEANLALVYQDQTTLACASQVRNRLAELVGEDAIQCTEWNINDLKVPSIYSQGVAALARADVIVVSLYEAERLPSVFYLWVNLWLQVRSGRPGALASLVVPNDQPGQRSLETRRYLCAVASQGRLELLECKRPSTPIRGLNVLQSAIGQLRRGR